VPNDAAPRFERFPLAWAIWYLEKHPELYRKFRFLADDYLAKKPRGLLSADMILHVIRYNSSGVDGDAYRLNNNLTPLYARLYQIERPNAPVKTRKSWLDELSEADTARLMFAFAPLRDGRLL
jgi:hypothetical protein